MDNNFEDAFPSNYMNKFIDHPSMILKKKGKYPFIISKTDTFMREETNWWSILDIEPKTHSFGFFWTQQILLDLMV